MLDTINSSGPGPEGMHLIHQFDSDSKKPSAETRRQYRDALGSFATGVTLITTNTADGPVGITVNSFASVSLDPALVLWSVDKNSGRYRVFKEARQFAIHVLADGQHEIAMMFAREACAFDAKDWFFDGDKPPLAKQALARFECINEAVHEGGDHSIIIGRVQRFSTRTGAPLIFSSGQFGGFTASSAT